MNDAQIQTAPKPQYRQPKYKGEAIAVTQSSEVTLGLIIGMAQHVHFAACFISWHRYKTVFRFSIAGIYAQHTHNHIVDTSHVIKP